MTLDTLNTAARAAGYALAGEPLADGAEHDRSRQVTLRLPKPAETASKPLDTMGWKDWFSMRMPRASA